MGIPGIPSGNSRNSRPVLRTWEFQVTITRQIDDWALKQLVQTQTRGNWNVLSKLLDSVDSVRLGSGRLDFGCHRVVVRYGAPVTLACTGHSTTPVAATVTTPAVATATTEAGGPAESATSGEGEGVRW